jgi:hypothetical protein
VRHPAVFIPILHVDFLNLHVVHFKLKKAEDPRCNLETLPFLLTAGVVTTTAGSHEIRLVRAL